MHITCIWDLSSHKHTVSKILENMSLWLFISSRRISGYLYILPYVVTHETCKHFTAVFAYTQCTRNQLPVLFLVAVEIPNITSQSVFLGFLNTNNKYSKTIVHLSIVFKYFIYQSKESRKAIFNALKIEKTLLPESQIPWSITWYYQWHTQSISDAGISVWAPKLGAQIKGELMQNNSYLIISSTQMRLHVLIHLI